MAGLELVAAIALAVAILGLAVITAVINRLARFLNRFKYVWRFLSGHTHNGQYHTNATWTRRADKVLHPTGRAHPWHWLPRGVRALIRTSSVLAAIGIIAGLYLATYLTLSILMLLAAAALSYLGWRAWLRLSEWQHYRTWERPLHRALTPVLGAPPARLAIEPDRSRVTIELPEHFIGEDRIREGIVRAVETKLALEAPEPSWRLDGKKPQVVFTRSEPPPSKVRWSDIASVVAAAKLDELACGLGKKSAPVLVSTTLDSPHFGIAMGTGGGKSNTAAFWLAQELQRGSIVLILDAKWFSHPWAFKDASAAYSQLPNVAYARSTQDLHNAMVWLGVELQRRTEKAERYVNARGDILGDVGAKIWIVAEELNLATPRLKQYWAAIRDKEMPKRSPALDGMAAVSFAGRAVNMHLIVIGQMLTAATLGGGDVRENIGVRALARYTANSWKMQTDLPMPPPSDTPGRVQVIASGTVREAQVPLMDFEQVRELAVCGTVTRCPADMPGIGPVSGVPVLESSNNGSDLGFVVGQGVNPGRPPGTMTLREAATEGLFTSLDAARKAVQRKGLQAAGRDGSSHLYFISDLAKTVRSV